MQLPQCGKCHIINRCLKHCSKPNPQHFCHLCTLHCCVINTVLQVSRRSRPVSFLPLLPTLKLHKCHEKADPLHFCYFYQFSNFTTQPQIEIERNQGGNIRFSSAPVFDPKLRQIHIRQSNCNLSSLNQ